MLTLVVSSESWSTRSAAATFGFQAHQTRDQSTLERQEDLVFFKFWVNWKTYYARTLSFSPSVMYCNLFCGYNGDYLMQLLLRRRAVTAWWHKRLVIKKGWYKTTVFLWLHFISMPGKQTNLSRALFLSIFIVCFTNDLMSFSTLGSIRRPSTHGITIRADCRITKGVFSTSYNPRLGDATDFFFCQVFDTSQSLYRLRSEQSTSDDQITLGYMYATSGRYDERSKFLIGSELLQSSYLAWLILDTPKQTNFYTVRSHTGKDIL